MPHSFDHGPTDPLTGPHLAADLGRRFVLNYPVPAAALRPFLPPGAELVTWDGLGWVSACVGSVDDLRGVDLPVPFGLLARCLPTVRYLIYHTRASLVFPDGVARDVSLVLECNVDRTPVAWMTRFLAGVQPRVRDVSVAESSDCWRLRMRDGEGAALFDAEIPRQSLAPALPPSARFGDPRECERYFLATSHFAHWNPPLSRVRLLAHSHAPCETLFGTSHTHHNVLVERLSGPPTAADHALTTDPTLHNVAFVPAEIDLGVSAYALPERAG